VPGEAVPGFGLGTSGPQVPIGCLVMWASRAVHPSSAGSKPLATGYDLTGLQTGPCDGS
jgi:hypothetical protein